MGRIHIKDIRGHIGQEVTLAGFVHTVRNQGNIVFLMLYDISGSVQVVITKDYLSIIKTAKNLSEESVVQVTGIAKTEAQSPGGI